MTLPHTFFYKFFQENMFFVVDKTIYNIKPSVNGQGVLFTSNKNFGINKGLRLSELEEIYFSNNDSELKSYGNGLLKKILADEKDVSKDYHKLGENLEFLEFVRYTLLKRKGVEKPKIKPIKIQEKNSYLIDKLFPGDCFVRKGKLYSLNKGKGLFNAKINNRDYTIGESLELSLYQLEKKYLESIEEKICNQLTKGQNSLLNKIGRLKEKKELIGVFKKGEFFDEKEYLGFKKDSKGFFVTTKAASDAPKKIDGKKTYVLYEKSNGLYYRFEAALIGVKLIKSSNGINWQDPVVIQPYIHPSLPQKSFTSYQRICPGAVDYNQITHGKSLEDAVKRLLSEGRRLILHGYFMKKGKGAYFSLSDKHFQKLEVKDYDPREVTNKK